MAVHENCQKSWKPCRKIVETKSDYFSPKMVIFPSEAHATGRRPVARSERSERSVGEALLHFIVLKKISRISTTPKKNISLIDFFDLLYKVHIKKNISPNRCTHMWADLFFVFLKVTIKRLNI